MMSMGAMLRELRLGRNLTQEKVADDLGITKSSWAMYERGERVPRDEIKVRIARYFDVTIEDLFFKPIEHTMCSGGE